MAATYYKYAERQADSYINWGEIGKNLTDMLGNEVKIREEKKAAIDKSSREFGETLANAPQGEEKQLNQWALEYAADAQQARLLQDRLLKSGQLKVKDYTVMRQNINDGTKNAFNLIKEYQDQYKVRLDRVKGDISQDFEGWLWKQAQNFGDFTKNKLYINPTNFQVSVAGTSKKMVDGKEVYVMDNNPNNYTTVNALRQRMSGTYDKYDLPKNVGAMVDGLGEEINSIERIGTLYKTGSITETLNIMNRTALPADAQGIVMKFEEAETKMLEAQLQNPYNTSSILTNTINTAPNGKPYDFTWDEKELAGNPHLILAKDNPSGAPTLQFTPEQEKAALERLRLEARMRYDKKVEIKATPQIQLQERRPITPTEAGRQNERDAAKNFAQNLVYSLTGNDVESDAGTKYIAAKRGLPFNKTESGYEVTDDKGKSQTYKFAADGKTLAQPEKFLKSLVGAANTIGLNEDDVMDYVRQLLPKGAGINLKTKAKGFNEAATIQDPLSIYGNFVETAASAEDIKGMTKSEAAKELNKKYVGLNITIKPSQLYNDKIFAVNKDGQESPLYDVKADPEGAIESIKEWIKSNPSGTTPGGKKKFVESLIKTGVIPSGKTGELD
jgi:hypothetical protein